MQHTDAASVPAEGSAGVTTMAAVRSDLACALAAGFLFLVPLYRTRTLEDSFNTPKLALAAIIGIIAAIALLARSTKGATASVRLWLPPWLLVIFVAVQAMSALWAYSKPLAVDGTVYFALFAVWGWIFLRTPTSVAAIRALFHAGALAAIVTAGWVLWEDFVGGTPGIVARLPDWRGLLSAGLGNSGHIAGMIGMFLPLLILNFLRTSTGAIKWLWLMGIILSFAALTVTWSVGSSGATILSLLLWGVVALKILPRHAIKWRRLGWIIAGGLAVVAFFFTPHPANPHEGGILKQAFSSDRWEAGWPTRIVIWKTTFHMISQDPILGIGTNNFTYMYPQQIVPSVHSDAALRVYAGSFTNDAHNDYLQVWAEGGVIGLGLWIAIVGTFYGGLFRLLRRQRNLESYNSADHAHLLIAAGAGFTVFALDGLMSFPMRLPAHFAMAAFFLAVPGMILRVSSEVQGITEVSPGGTRHVRNWRFAGVGILLTLAACSWHIGHRVAAEFYLKAGRNIAETPMLNTGTALTSPWNACRGFYVHILESIAMGASAQELEDSLAAMKEIATTNPMPETRDFFEKATNINRWYANASSRLGDLLIFQNEWQQCLDISRRTLKTLETHEVHERMGLAAYMMGDMQRARFHWTICRDRRPYMAEFYNMLVGRTDQ